VKSASNNGGKHEMKKKEEESRQKRGRLEKEKQLRKEEVFRAKQMKAEADAKKQQTTRMSVRRRQKNRPLSAPQAIDASEPLVIDKKGAIAGEDEATSKAATKIQSLSRGRAARRRVRRRRLTRPKPCDEQGGESDGDAPEEREINTIVDINTITSDATMNNGDEGMVQKQKGGGNGDSTPPSANEDKARKKALAATGIQSVSRGRTAMRKTKRMKEHPDEVASQEGSSSSDAPVNGDIDEENKRKESSAVVKIQSLGRGRAVRRKIKDASRELSVSILQPVREPAESFSLPTSTKARTPKTKSPNSKSQKHTPSRSQADTQTSTGHARDEKLGKVSPTKHTPKVPSVSSPALHKKSPSAVSSPKAYPSMEKTVALVDNDAKRLRSPKGHTARVGSPTRSLLSHGGEAGRNSQRQSHPTHGESTTSPSTTDTIPKLIPESVAVDEVTQEVVSNAVDDKALMRPTEMGSDSQDAHTIIDAPITIAKESPANVVIQSQHESSVQQPERLPSTNKHASTKFSVMGFFSPKSTGAEKESQKIGSEPTDKELAATKIQAIGRGRAARKKAESIKSEASTPKSSGLFGFLSFASPKTQSPPSEQNAEAVGDAVLSKETAIPENEEEERSHREQEQRPRIPMEAERPIPTETLIELIDALGGTLPLPPDDEEGKKKQQAATKIQSIGRGWSARKKKKDDDLNTEPSNPKPAGGLFGFLSPKASKVEGQSKSSSPPSSNAIPVSDSVTPQDKLTPPVEKATAVNQDGAASMKEKDIKNKALAATKIQSISRGWATRKKTESIRSEPPPPQKQGLFGFLSPKSQKTEESSPSPIHPAEEVVPVANISASQEKLDVLPTGQEEGPSMDASEKTKVSVADDGVEAKSKAVAATKIQSITRGRSARKQMDIVKKEPSAPKKGLFGFVTSKSPHGEKQCRASKEAAGATVAAAATAENKVVTSSGQQEGTDGLTSTEILQPLPADLPPARATTPLTAASTPTTSMSPPTPTTTTISTVPTLTTITTTTTTTPIATTSTSSATTGTSSTATILNATSPPPSTANEDQPLLFSYREDTPLVPRHPDEQQGDAEVSMPSLVTPATHAIKDEQLEPIVEKQSAPDPSTKASRPSSGMFSSLLSPKVKKEEEILTAEEKAVREEEVRRQRTAKVEEEKRRKVRDDQHFLLATAGADAVTMDWVGCRGILTFEGGGEGEKAGGGGGKEEKERGGGRGAEEEKRG